MDAVDDFAVLVKEVFALSETDEFVLGRIVELPISLLLLLQGVLGILVSYHAE